MFSFCCDIPSDLETIAGYSGHKSTIYIKNANTLISVCNQPAIQGQLSLPSLRGRYMSTSFGWEGKGRYGSLR